MFETLSDRRIQAAIDGERAALDDVVKEAIPHVYQWCARLGGPRIDSEDAAHEVMMILCRKIHVVNHPKQLPSWLFATSRRVVANHRRRGWLKRWVGAPVGDTHFTEGLSPEALTSQNQTGVMVREALDEVPAKQREVLVLADLEDRSTSQVAELLGVPQGTVKSRLRLGREALRKSLYRRLGHAEWDRLRGVS